MFSSFGELGSSGSCLGMVRFERQPPADLRKSNFFSFEVSLTDLNEQIVLIDEAHFIEFLDGPEEQLKNGIKYGATLRFVNESQEICSFVIRLVDAATGQPVPYEGQDGNPKMQRVLLTHEVTCARCSQKKSCGNKNETPSDPVICHNRTMKFYLKCNQNCLKSAGNPRDMRRFRIMFYTDENYKIKSHILGTSENIFVHNNSKHTRKRTILPNSESPISNKRSRWQNERLPKVHSIDPDTGFFFQRILVLGENFNSEVQIYLNGNIPLRTKLLSPTALTANVPPYRQNCDLYISVRDKDNIYFNGFLFKYIFKANTVPVVKDVYHKGPGLVCISGKNLDCDGLQVYLGGTPLRMQISPTEIQAEILQCIGSPAPAHLPVTVFWENIMIFYPERHTDQSTSDESGLSPVDVSSISPVQLNTSSINSSRPDQVLDPVPSCMALSRMSNAPPGYPTPYSNNSLMCNTSVPQYRNQMLPSTSFLNPPYFHTPESILQYNRGSTT